MNLIPRILIFMLALWLAWPAYGQPSMGGVPLSFSPAFEQEHNRLPRTQAVERVHLRRALAEDERGPGSRFTVPLAVDLGPENAGEWTVLPDGGSVWRLKVRSSGALALAFLYDRFYLPPGATFFMYSEDRRQVLGAYTSLSNPRGGKFMTGLVTGESAIIEYFEPREVTGQGRIHLFRVDRAYRSDFKEIAVPGARTHSGAALPGFGASLACNVNANCDAGESLRRQQRSVCRILIVVEEGIGYCTGTLMNNTRQDGRPYVLSAFHCQDGYKPLYDFWRFDFNYEGPGCENPAKEPGFKSILGCSRMAGRRENDLLLLEMATFVPPSYGVFFAGWDRRTAAPTSAVCFHHPVGDIKKISTIDGNIRVFNSTIDWNNEVQTPASHHFTMNFTTGTFELGSSGNGLFNQEGLIVGTLHGGNPNCGQTQAYYARLALAWDGAGTPQSRLQDWLDPVNAGVPKLAGTENPVSGMGVMAGVVRTEDLRPVPGVTVRLTSTGTDTLTTVTNAAGEYQFENLPLGEYYSLMLKRDGDDINGLTTLDLIRIRKHILNLERLDSPYKLLAADANGSGGITTLDIIKISKVILGVSPRFDEIPSWRFVPGAVRFTDPADPFKDPFPVPVYSLLDFRSDIGDLDFIGIKTGDVNNSVKPL